MCLANIHSISSYLKYYLTSQTKYKIHSPFVYDLVTNVLENNEPEISFDQIQKLYKELSISSRVLETTDFGGSQNNRTYQTKFLPISNIAKNASIFNNSGKLLFRLVQHFKPLKILELGTSLGISTLYLAKAAPNATITTIEGCAAKVEIARANFTKMNITNVEVRTGRFDTQLPLILDQIEHPDFVFIDGHHQLRPTVDYFQRIIKHSLETTVFVIDDIHWSTGMEKAWKVIQQLPEVTVTIDLYRLGLVFLNKSLSKQDFILRF